MKKLVFMLLLSFAAALFAFEGDISLGGKKLLLSGQGWRKATFLKIKVYEGALYLEQKSSDASTILSGTSLKALQLKFARDVGTKDIKKTFFEGYEKNVAKDLFQRQKKNLEELCQFFGDVKENDLLTLHFFNDRLEVIKNKKEQKTFSDKEFSHSLLSIWLGKEALDSDLKQGLLGL